MTAENWGMGREIPCGWGVSRVGIGEVGETGMKTGGREAGKKQKDIYRARGQPNAKNGR